MPEVLPVLSQRTGSGWPDAAEFTHLAAEFTHLTACDLPAPAPGDQPVVVLGPESWDRRRPDRRWCALPAQRAETFGWSIMVAEGLVQQDTYTRALADVSAGHPTEVVAQVTVRNDAEETVATAEFTVAIRPRKTAPR